MGTLADMNPGQLEKLRRWFEKQNTKTGACPQCVERCIMPAKGGKDESNTTRNR